MSKNRNNYETDPSPKGIFLFWLIGGWAVALMGVFFSLTLGFPQLWDLTHSNSINNPVAYFLYAGLAIFGAFFAAYSSSIEQLQARLLGLLLICYCPAVVALSLTLGSSSHS